MIPLFCDLTGKRVVILGGGRVALRKARRFAPEADLSVYAPELRAGFAELSCEAVRERVDAERAREVLNGAFLAVVATDDAALNGQFTRIAREEDCLVNRTDRPGVETEASADTDTESETSARALDSVGDDPAGDVIVPSTIAADPITAAITTGGSSPAMAKYLRRRIEPLLEEAAPMVRLQSDLRAELKRTVEGSPERRERLWRVIESEAVWEALAAGEAERARRLARERAGLPVHGIE